MSDYDRLKNVIIQRLKEGVDPQTPSTSDANAELQNSVRVSAPSLYASLEKAALKCHCDVSELTYEIMSETGDPLHGDKWVVIHAQKQEAVSDTMDASAVTTDGVVPEPDSDDEPQQIAHPAYSIKKQPGKVMLRLDRQHVDFERLTVAELRSAIGKRTQQNPDNAALQQCFDATDNAYHTVAVFAHDILQDATHSIVYSLHNITARIVLKPPRKNGAEYSILRVLEVLRNEGITYGVDRTLLSEIEEYPRYNHPYLIAKGSPPVDGQHARIVYSNEMRDAMMLASKRIASLGPNERLNYKEQHSILNVLRGVVLARLSPAEQGQDGTNVFGDTIRAKDGEARQLRVGRNVELSADGSQAIAATAGQFHFKDGLFVVDPLHEVQGDVGIKSGNVLFLGNVIVRGNVDDGFSVRASGTIEIHGFIGAARIDSEAEVTIRKGIAGKGRAFINSGGDCTAQYIESATVHAVGSVITKESIIQSTVLAGEQIRCTGKHANIVGGEVISGKQIVAKTIGSDLGVRTKVSVGRDPFLLMRLDILHNRQNTLSQQLRHLKLMQRKSDVQFKTAGAEYKLSKVEQVEGEVMTTENELAFLEADIEILREEIATKQLQGEIIATRTVHQNVEISINGVEKTLQEDRNRLRLTMENNKIVARTSEARVG